ncbi:MAG: hypothetical protein RML72_05740 [Bacteroidia bacterium]|nr:hypothetical protein [Bacteroidia bacterium]MDW8158363.1 hypothetical protein [Bacteroidia bacterium]
MLRAVIIFIIHLFALQGAIVAQSFQNGEEDPAEAFRISYEQLALRSKLWQVRRLNLFRMEPVRLYWPYLVLPDNKSLLYTTYDVYPFDLASAMAFGGQGTRMQPVSSNIWVGVDQMYNTPGYLFLRGLFEPYGIGTGLMRSWLGVPAGLPIR